MENEALLGLVQIRAVTQQISCTGSDGRTMPAADQADLVQQKCFSLGLSAVLMWPKMSRVVSINNYITCVHEQFTHPSNTLMVDLLRRANINRF